VREDELLEQMSKYTFLALILNKDQKKNIPSWNMSIMETLAEEDK
jgi:hypothetical protein